MSAQLRLGLELGASSVRATGGAKRVPRRTQAKVEPLLDAATDAALSAVPAEQVAWARMAWAVHHMPPDAVAEVLGLERATVDQMLTAGRPDRPAATGTVYDRLPWPEDAAACLLAASGAGRERLASIGEKNVRAKLTAEQVVEIRRLVVEDEVSVASIAESLGLHHSSVQDLCRGVTWSHVGGPLLGVAQEVEDREIAVGTGRLQRLGAGGQVLATYRSVAAAAAASGLDRVVIAANANGPAREWRYEPDLVPNADHGPAEWVEALANDLAPNGQSWAPLTGPRPTFDQMVMQQSAPRRRRPADRDR